MTRDEMKAKLAAVIGAAIIGKTSTQGASDAAAAVLDLCGPKPLEWQRDETNCCIWDCHSADSNQYRLLYSERHGDYTVLIDGKWVLYDTLEAAQAAAQEHADAAHWANTPMGGFVMSKDTSGPAFPLQPASMPETHQSGMTLRDWFAGQVIASVKGWHPADRVGKSAAVIAYEIADAMLEARK